VEVAVFDEVLGDAAARRRLQQVGCCRFQANLAASEASVIHVESGCAIRMSPSLMPKPPSARAHLR
jgi:hypothetical protein